MLEPEQQQFLRHVSEVFLSNLPLKVMNSMSLGTTLVLYPYALWLIRERGSQGSSARIVVAAATVCFLASIAGFGANLAMEAVHYQTFTDRSNYGPNVTPESVVRIVNKKEAKATLVQHLAEYPILGISDALVLWRTQALYPDTSQLVIRVLTTSLVASTVLLFLAASGLAYRMDNTSVDIADTCYSLAQTVSCFTNVATTILVGSRLWRHRRWLNKHLHDVHMRFSPVQKKILLLVETGFAFCIVQGAVTIMGWTGLTTMVEKSFCYFVILLQFAFATNYTPILLILMQTKTSVTDSLCILDNPVHLGDQNQPIELSEFPEHYVD